MDFKKEMERLTYLSMLNEINLKAENKVAEDDVTGFIDGLSYLAQSEEKDGVKTTWLDVDTKWRVYKLMYPDAMYTSETRIVKLEGKEVMEANLYLYRDAKDNQVGPEGKRTGYNAHATKALALSLVPIFEDTDTRVSLWAKMTIKSALSAALEIEGVCPWIPSREEIQETAPMDKEMVEKKLEQSEQVKKALADIKTKVAEHVKSPNSPESVQKKDAAADSQPESMDNGNNVQQVSDKPKEPVKNKTQEKAKDTNPKVKPESASKKDDSPLPFDNDADLATAFAFKVKIKGEEKNLGQVAENDPGYLVKLYNYARNHKEEILLVHVRTILKTGNYNDVLKKKGLDVNTI